LSFLLLRFWKPPIHRLGRPVFKSKFHLIEFGHFKIISGCAVAISKYIRAFTKVSLPVLLGE
jgi:hypothetical protein